MSRTQLIVLFVTFLTASLVVVPLIILAFKKERQRKEEHQAKLKRERDREVKREQEQEQRLVEEDIRKRNAQKVADFQQSRDRFKELLYMIYKSTTCEHCNSAAVTLQGYDPQSGRRDLQCMKCGEKRTDKVGNSEAFTRHMNELAQLVEDYQAIQRFASDLPDLMFSANKR